MQTFQTTTGPETPQQENPEYVAAMVAKADGLSGEPQVPQVEDKLLAGKYKSVEELEKGYAELQKAFSSKQQQPAAKEAETVENPLTIPEATEQASELLESKGLDITAFNQEWQETGTLSDSSYEQLAKAGIPPEMVNAYIEGQQLKAELLTTRVFDTAGGHEDYVKLVTWAKDNLPKSEVDAYNSVVSSEDINQIILAVKGLKATYEDKYGKNPQLITGDATSNSSGEAYTSKAQMRVDMSDPRYKKDPAFRAEVERKLARSTIF